MGDIIARAMADRSARLNPGIWPSLWDYLAYNRAEKRFLMIGDSLTTDAQGHYPLEMAANIRERLGVTDFQYDRYAYGGFRWADVPFDDVMAASPHARVVTVMLGTNDARSPKGTVGAFLWSTYGVAYERLEKMLVANSPGRVSLVGASLRLLLTPWVRDDVTDVAYQPVATYRANQALVNRVLRGMSRKYCQVEALDTHALTEGQTTWYQADGVHFNQLGGRHVAVSVLNHLRERSRFTADPYFLTGKPYTITTALALSPSYPETDRKLSARNHHDNANLLANQLGYQGALGTTGQVVVEFWFGGDVVLNDLVMRFGRPADGYAPDTITVEKLVGGVWSVQATLNATSEESSTTCPQLVNYIPATPFRTRSLRLTFAKTFAVGRDWLFLGQIEATKLDGYGGSVS